MREYVTPETIRQLGTTVITPRGVPMGNIVYHNGKYHVCIRRNGQDCGNYFTTDEDARAALCSWWNRGEVTRT